MTKGNKSCTNILTSYSNYNQESPTKKTSDKVDCTKNKIHALKILRVYLTTHRFLRQFFLLNDFPLCNHEIQPTFLYFSSFYGVIEWKCWRERKGEKKIKWKSLFSVNSRLELCNSVVGPIFWGVFFFSFSSSRKWDDDRGSCCCCFEIAICFEYAICWCWWWTGRGEI